MSTFDSSLPLNFVAFGLALTPVAYLIVVAWPLARTDLRERRLPNSLTLPGLGLALVAQTLASLALCFSALAEGRSGWAEVFAQGFANQGGALVAGAVMFGLSLAAHIWAGLGMGDVKLLTVIALSLGWFNPWSPLLALMVGLAAAVVVSVLSVLRGRAKLSTSLPLGPYLLAGFLAACAVMAAGGSAPPNYLVS